MSSEALKKNPPIIDQQKSPEKQQEQKEAPHNLFTKFNAIVEEYKQGLNKNQYGPDLLYDNSIKEKLSETADYIRETITNLGFYSPEMLDRFGFDGNEILKLKKKLEKKQKEILIKLTKKLQILIPTTNDRLWMLSNELDQLKKTATNMNDSYENNTQFNTFDTSIEKTLRNKGKISFDSFKASFVRIQKEYERMIKNTEQFDGMRFLDEGSDDTKAIQEFEDLRTDMNKKLGRDSGKRSPIFIEMLHDIRKDLIPKPQRSHLKMRQNIESFRKKYKIERT